MSADLFAAFNTSSEAPRENQPQQNTVPFGSSQSSNPANDLFTSLQSNTGPTRPQIAHQATQWPTLGSQHTPSPTIPGPSWLQSEPQPPAMQPQVKEEEDDGWGDFEVASPQIADFPTSKITKPESSMAEATMISQHRPTRIIRASTIELMTNSLVDLGPGTSKLDPVVESPSWIRKSTESIAKAKIRILTYYLMPMTSTNDNCLRTGMKMILVTSKGQRPGPCKLQRHQLPICCRSTTLLNRRGHERLHQASYCLPCPLLMGRRCILSHQNHPLFRNEIRFQGSG